jgi:hypothetical protein
MGRQTTQVGNKLLELYGTLHANRMLTCHYEIIEDRCHTYDEPLRSEHTCGSPSFSKTRTFNEVISTCETIKQCAF